ncbi:MAG TPA: hypothetical protein VMZ53_03535 [Kofleriaceae bacterium]|nr:hypothetical protein [Kofleriaceae bacterium]
MAPLVLTVAFPVLPANSVSVTVFAVVAVPSVTVMTVPVCNAPTFWLVVQIEPCTPAAAAPLSNTTAVLGATVHVLPIESVTFVMSFVAPPVELLSAAIAIATNAPIVQLVAGETVNVSALTLCVPVPRFVIEMVTRTFHPPRRLLDHDSVIAVAVLSCGVMPLPVTIDGEIAPA